MKKYVYILVLLIPHVMIPCALSQSGQRVWNIATKNIFITQSIESSIDQVPSIDTITAFSNFDQLLGQVTIIASKASLLSQEINHLQNNLIVDLSKTEQIQSNIQVIENSLTLLDISSVFTALDALQTTVVSALDLLNTDLEIIATNIDVLSASQIEYLQTVASQLDKLDEDVARVNSLLEALSAQFSLTTFDSATDLVHQDLVLLESNVDLLTDQLAGGFEDIFSVLDQNMLLAQTVESLADSLDVMDDSDLTGTYSLLDQLEISVQTMDSLTDLLVDTFQSIASAIDISESALDQSVSKYVLIESRISLIIQKIQDMIIDPAFSHMDHATSLLDQDISLLENAYTADLPALTTSIESKLDHIIAQQDQQISDLDTIASNLGAITNIQSGTIISKLEIANSLLDDTIDKVFTTESYLNPLTQHSEQLFAITDNAQTLNDQLNYVDLIVPEISSKMILVDDLLATTDSTLDIITIIAESNLDDVIALESMVDTLSFVAQPSDSISMLDIINSQEDVVISKLALVLQLIASEDNKAQGLIGDFQSTWTILQSIDTKLAQAYSSLSLTDAAIDAFSYSSVFTAIDTIVRNEATVDSQVDVYNSMVNALTNTIKVDFNGVFTALADINNSAANSSSMLSIISSKLSVVQTELGFPIYARDLPLTITTSGRYYLAENINYSGASNAITINTNNVSIDCNGLMLNYMGAATVAGLNINGVSNIKITNGFITNFGDGGGIVFSAGSTNIIICGVTLINSNLASQGRNLKIYSCTFKGALPDDSISTRLCTNLDIQDCLLFSHRGIESRANCSHVIVERCLFYNAISDQAFGFNGTIINWILKGCTVMLGSNGYNSNSVVRAGCDILNSFFMGQSSFAVNLSGAGGVIKNNTIVQSTRGLINARADRPPTNSCMCFNELIQNTVGNIILADANTYLGNFAFNTNAVGNPNNTNYNFSAGTTDITGKFVTISQRTGISGAVAPTYWHNINMLP